MPSKDPLTGRRLNGSKQRERAQLRAAGRNPDAVVPTLAVVQSGRTPTDADLVDMHALGIAEPPLAGGPHAVEVWGVHTRAALAVALIDADNAAIGAISAATVALRALAKLRPLALVAHDAVTMRERLQGVVADLDTDVPPQDVAELMLWAYRKIARIAWSATRMEAPAAWRLVATAATLAELSRSPCESYFAAAADELEAAGNAPDTGEDAG